MNNHSTSSEHNRRRSRPRPVAVNPVGGGWLIKLDNGNWDFYDTLEQPWDLAYGQEVLRLAANGTAATSPTHEPKPQAAPVMFYDADEDGETLDWPGEWAHGEEGRIWLATGQGEYTLLAGLPGKGKSHLAQELAARERENGGHPLAIVPEAANSWRHRNRQLPPGARVHIVAGVPDLERLRQVLTERHKAGKPWPTLIVVDPATLAVAEWANVRHEAATYSYPVVSWAIAALEAATADPDGNRPKLIWCVHTPETEQGGRGKRAVGGYTQGAGVAYLLPQVGKVSVLKPPRDCPEVLPPKAMLYTLDSGRISYIGQATRDLSHQAARILDQIGESGEWGITKRQLRDTLKGIGRATLAQVIPDLLARKLIHETTDTGLTGDPITRYTISPPTTTQPAAEQFRMPNEPPF